MPERPWEKWMIGSSSVMEEEGIYKMWCRSWSDEGRHLCYATSEDGLDWRRPDLDLVQFKGKPGGNIVLNKSQGDELKLNVDTSAVGDVRVELIGENLLPIAGFKLRNCDRIIAKKQQRLFLGDENRVCPRYRKGH